jgi:hypothetical protein
VAGYILCDDCTRTDHGILSDVHAGQDDCTRTDGRAAANQDRVHFPILGSLETAIGRNRAGKAIVGQASQRPYEHTVLDRDAMVEQRPVLNLDVVTDNDIEVHVNSLAYNAIPADRRAFPHLRLMPDAGSFPNPGSGSNFRRWMHDHTRIFAEMATCIPMGPFKEGIGW